MCDLVGPPFLPSSLLRPSFLSPSFCIVPSPAVIFQERNSRLSSPPLPSPSPSPQICGMISHVPRGGLCSTRKGKPSATSSTSPSRRAAVRVAKCAPFRTSCQTALLTLQGYRSFLAGLQPPVSSPANPSPDLASALGKMYRPLYEVRPPSKPRSSLGLGQ